LSSLWRRRHNLVVIGGGSAGLVAVDFGGTFGARGLLLESDFAQ